ncbi:dihydroorotase [Spirochaetia bacterium]|nr:dihydroorotase [Spirochaetia bacterium]
MSRLVLENFRIVDKTTDILGTVIVEDGLIKDVLPGQNSGAVHNADMVIDGSGKVLMPAFVDLHAHFRDPGFPEKETLESASLAAVSGGYGTVICMANTKPVIDTMEKAASLKVRSDTLGLIDLYPVLSLTKGMEGKELSGIAALNGYTPLMISEDGKDVIDEKIFLAAMAEAKRLNIPVSCHCDFGGDENAATERAIALGIEAGCHIHIAHVSTKKAMDFIVGKKHSLKLSCEVTPHHLAATEADARRLGNDSWGRVNPPLRTEDDRQALIAAVKNGFADAIATDHAPHSHADKKNGAPGFTGLETAFGVCVKELVETNVIDLPALSGLLSANPAEILGLKNRGRVMPNFRADLVIADINAPWVVKPEIFKSRGENSPFAGRKLKGKILMTLHHGRIVFDDGGNYERLCNG